MYIYSRGSDLRMKFIIKTIMPLSNVICGPIQNKIKFKINQ